MHSRAVPANTTGAAWSRMEPHGAAWSRMELHGAAWSNRVNFKYYRSRMETLSIRSRDARNRIEPHGAAWSRMELHGATV